MVSLDPDRSVAAGSDGERRAHRARPVGVEPPEALGQLPDIHVDYGVELDDACRWDRAGWWIRPSLRG